MGKSKRVMIGSVALAYGFLFTSSTLFAQGTISLPVTGQTTVYYAGDDGDIKAGVAWPSPRFEDHDPEDFTMTDLLTGLRWTKNANAPGPAACSPGVTKQWQPALDYVACLNTNNYLGFGDWRLPNVNEMYSLYYYRGGPVGSWLISQGFSNVQGTNYWSSTTDAYKTENAWAVKATAAVTSAAKTLRLPVWPVRGTTAAPAKVWKTGQTTIYAAGDDGAIQAGEAWPIPRFVASGSCITDQLTGLMWVKNPDASVRPWQNALMYANDLNICGFTDWRLANITELRSLQNFGVADSAAWLNLQGFENIQLDRYWSSNTDSGSTAWGWVASLWGSGSSFSIERTSWTKLSRNYVLALRTAGSPSPFSILTVTKTGSGSGSVTSGDGYINCGATCAKRYASSTVVNLTATPDGTSTFTGWSGDPDCSDGQVILSADKKCTATFNLPPPQYGVTLTKTGFGSNTVKTADGAISCGTICTAVYSPGVTVTLVAAPGAGAAFSGWSGDADCSDGQLTMDAAKACTATFSERTPPQITRLQRTGQVTTYDTGDDGEIQAGLAWPSPRFSVAGDCVTDHLTGLVWLRDPEFIYRTWSQAVSYGANFTACGHDDWRLPNANELFSLLTSSAGTEAQWLNSQGFSVTEGTIFWSSTSSPRQPFFAFKLGTGLDLIDFSDGNSTIHIGGDKRTERKAAWPVRGISSGPVVVAKTGLATCYDLAGTVIPCAGTGQDGDLQSGGSWPNPRFETRGECVIDKLSGLMWPANANLYSTSPGFDDPVSWYVALDRANDLELCSCSDWRLPNRNEIWSLNNRGVADFYAWTNAQGFTNLVDLRCVWTSTTTPYVSGAAVIYFMGDVNENIFTDKTFSGSGACDAWPVRTAYFNLSVAKTGSGSGVVTSPDGGVSCGSDCAQSYLYGTSVNLTAVADAGSYLTGWTGCDVVSGTICTVNVTDARTVTANFLPGYVLSVSRSGSGTGGVASSPGGIDCGTTCSAGYAAGTVVTLTPSALPGSEFNGWSGECTGMGTCQITMDATKSVTARFKLSGNATGFYPVTPCRVFDTREASGAPIIAGGTQRTFIIAAKCGIPIEAKAIVANATVVNGSAVGNMSIIAGNLTSTLTTTIEIPLSRARANNAMIQLATDGAGTIMVINNSSGTVNLILDVSGYFE